VNDIIITEAIWRELPAELRRALRQVLKGKSAIVGRQVLDVVQALGEHGAYGLAFDLYQVLDGQPLMPLPGLRFWVDDEFQSVHGPAGPAPLGDNPGLARRVMRTLIIIVVVAPEAVMGIPLSKVVP
jgi:hypothetical protein